MIIFDKQTTKEVYTILEDIRITFNNKKFRNLNNERLSFSGGISKLKKSYDADKWIGNADSALYNSKNNGRNKISIYE